MKLILVVIFGILYDTVHTAPVSALLFMVAMTLAPNANNLMLAHSVVTVGRVKSLPRYVGACFKYLLMFLLVIALLTELFVQYPFLKDYSVIFSAAYLLYYVYKIVIPTQASNPYSGAAVWNNPAVWLMIICAVTLYTPTTHQALYTPSIFTFNAFLKLGYALYAINGSVLFFLISLLSGLVWLFFGQHLRNSAVFNFTIGSILAISVIMAFLQYKLYYA